MGGEGDHLLLSNTAGYGFLVSVVELQTRQSNGKAVMNVPKGALMLPPFPVEDRENDLLAAATDHGRLLVFPVSEMSVLAKGKGIKILNIPKGRQEKESLVGAVTLGERSVLRVHAGKRYLTFKIAELEPYRGDRALRGNLLQKGFRGVSALEVVAR
jgi:topoisomerase-4 subunit A